MTFAVLALRVILTRYCKLWSFLYLYYLHYIIILYLYTFIFILYRCSFQNDILHSLQYVKCSKNFLWKWQEWIVIKDNKHTKLISVHINERSTVCSHCVQCESCTSLQWQPTIVTWHLPHFKNLVEPHRPIVYHGYTHSRTLTTQPATQHRAIN